MTWLWSFVLVVLTGMILSIALIISPALLALVGLHWLQRAARRAAMRSYVGQE